MDCVKVSSAFCKTCWNGPNIWVRFNISSPHLETRIGHGPMDSCLPLMTHHEPRLGNQSTVSLCYNQVSKNWTSDQVSHFPRCWGWGGGGGSVSVVQGELNKAHLHVLLALASKRKAAFLLWKGLAHRPARWWQENLQLTDRQAVESVRLASSSPLSLLMHLQMPSSFFRVLRTVCSQPSFYPLYWWPKKLTLM